jgi:beta-lactamase regulating signal transducer with metallopeptidase domain
MTVVRSTLERVQFNSAINVSVSLLDGVIGIWVIGALVTTIISVLKLIKTHRFIQRWGTEENHEKKEIFDQLLNEKQLSSIKLIQCDTNLYAFTYGLINPVIVVNKNVSIQDFKYIVKHELEHIVSKDYLFNSLMLISLSIHWFNPIFWIFSKQLTKQMELKCDECVHQALAIDQKKEYSQTIISIAKQLRLNESNYLLSSITQKKLIKDRIQTIFSNKENRFKTIIQISVVLIIIVFGTFNLLTDTVESILIKPLEYAKLYSFNINEDKISIYEIRNDLSMNYLKEYVTQLSKNDELFEDYHMNYVEKKLVIYNDYTSQVGFTYLPKANECTIDWVETNNDKTYSNSIKLSFLPIESNMLAVNKVYFETLRLKDELTKYFVKNNMSHLNNNEIRTSIENVLKSLGSNLKLEEISTNSQHEVYVSDTNKVTNFNEYIEDAGLKFYISELDYVSLSELSKSDIYQSIGAELTEDILVETSDKQYVRLSNQDIVNVVDPIEMNNWTISIGVKLNQNKSLEKVKASKEYEATIREVVNTILRDDLSIDVLKSRVDKIKTQLTKSFDIPRSDIHVEIITVSE